MKVDRNNNKIITDNGVINIEIIRRSKKNIIFKMIKKDKLQISVPKFAKEEIIFQVLEKNIEEIIKFKENIDDNIENIYYMGNKYSLKFSYGENDIKFNNETKTCEVFCRNDKQYNLVLKRFFFNETNRIIKDRVLFYKDKMGVMPSKVTIKDVKSIWGSCSGKDNITFNYKLSMVLENQIDYIVVHELSHIVHKNHSRDFWKLVEYYIEDYKNIRKSLNEITRKLPDLE